MRLAFSLRCLTDRGCASAQAFLSFVLGRGRQAPAVILFPHFAEAQAMWWDYLLAVVFGTFGLLVILAKALFGNWLSAAATGLSLVGGVSLVFGTGWGTEHPAARRVWVGFLASVGILLFFNAILEVASYAQPVSPPTSQAIDPQLLTRNVQEKLSELAMQPVEVMTLSLQEDGTYRGEVYTGGERAGIVVTIEGNFYRWQIVPLPGSAPSE
jgi:hypothetical protein